MRQRILIVGIDGYIGWALALHLLAKGHEVAGIDNFSRRKNVQEIGSISAMPILEMQDRLYHIDNKIVFKEGDLQDSGFVKDVLKMFKPDTIIHLGEQPSAPFSQIDMEHAVSTQKNNVIGTMNLLFAIKEVVPNCHLVKLGTMGEYATPNIEISEGPIEIEYKGRKDKIHFPRNANSWYHLSKVHDTNNIIFANRIWGLRCTDIMQGVVYGTRTDEITKEELGTRFDFDECFGTVINRYCAQAVIGHPLTPYGKGGQTRGFIALEDSIQCLRIATENPPHKDEGYRVFNQIASTYSINKLAEIVKDAAAKELDVDVEIKSVPNPRMEKEEHYYKVEAERLKQLGFKETRPMEKQVRLMLQDLRSHRKEIMAYEHAIMPKSLWNNLVVAK